MCAQIFLNLLNWLDIITCGPSIYTIDHLKIIVSIQNEEPITA